MSSQPVYIRLSTENGIPYFKNRSAAEALIGAVIDAQKQEWMHLHGFVVLPEALEMVATPVKQGVAGMVAYIEAETIPLLAILLPNAMSIWEPHYQHIPLTSQRALDARLAMLLLAPVASSIVEAAPVYPYSSANLRYVTSVTAYTGFKHSVTPEVERVS